MWKSELGCSGLSEPDFDEDPSAWFDWFEDCMSGEPPDPGGEPPEPPDIPCKPRRWIDNEGRCWDRVCTADGPELRPCFVEPVIQGTAKPAITAIHLTGDNILVQVTTSRGVKVHNLAPGDVKLSHLANALFQRAVLPSADIRRIPGDFWARQKPVSVKRTY
jgi:hypothetical protein